MRWLWPFSAPPSYCLPRLRPPARSAWPIPCAFPLRAIPARRRKQSAALSEKARNERFQKIQKQAQELETKGTAYTQRLSRVQQAINSQMNEVMRTACENYAKKNGYDMIIDASVVMFYVQANDVTSGLIEEVNKVWKDKGGKFNLSSVK